MSEKAADGGRDSEKALVEQLNGDVQALAAVLERLAYLLGVRSVEASRRVRDSLDVQVPASRAGDGDVSVASGPWPIAAGARHLPGDRGDRGAASRDRNVATKSLPAPQSRPSQARPSSDLACIDGVRTAAGALAGQAIGRTGPPSSATDGGFQAGPVAGPSASSRQPVGRERRHRTDGPDLDADLRAWHAVECDRPRVGILGEVIIDAPGEPPADRRGFYAEIIVYLAAVGDRGATAEELEAAIWPGRHITGSSRRVALTRVRRWLGHTDTGCPWLPPAVPDQKYRLVDGYLLDWDLFRRLRARGEQRGASGADDLRQALELVRGVPLLHAEVAHHCSSRSPYGWLASCGVRPSQLTSEVVDTAHRLVQISLGAGDSLTARWAVEQARSAGPDRLTDYLWVDLVRITAATGDGSELRELLDQATRGRAGKLLQTPSRIIGLERQLRELAGDDRPLPETASGRWLL